MTQLHHDVWALQESHSDSSYFGLTLFAALRDHTPQLAAVWSTLAGCLARSCGADLARPYATSQVLEQTINGQRHEPFELVDVELPEEYSGS
eukprot:2502522-Pleurochrysis_carterae.AAC.1